MEPSSDIVPVSGNQPTNESLQDNPLPLAPPQALVHLDHTEDSEEDEVRPVEWWKLPVGPRDVYNSLYVRKNVFNEMTIPLSSNDKAAEELPVNVSYQKKIYKFKLRKDSNGDARFYGWEKFRLEHNIGKRSEVAISWEDPQSLTLKIEITKLKKANKALPAIVEPQEDVEAGAAHDDVATVEPQGASGTVTEVAVEPQGAPGTVTEVAVEPHVAVGTDADADADAEPQAGGVVIPQVAVGTDSTAEESQEGSQSPAIESLPVPLFVDKLAEKAATAPSPPEDLFYLPPELQGNMPEAESEFL